MKGKYSTDPRFGNPTAASALLAQELMKQGQGNISNIGEGIRSAVGSLTGAYLADKNSQDNAQAQKDYYKELGTLQRLNKESSGSNDDLVNAMASSPNPFVQQDAQGIKNQIFAEQLKPTKPETVNAGGALVDPKTGKVIYTSPVATAGGGATGAIVDRAMNDPEFARMLQQYQTGWRQGIMPDGNGGVTPMPGYAEAKGNIQNAEQTGKNLSDLTYKPKIAVDTKKAEAQADMDISDAKTAPLINNLLSLNEKTFDMPNAGALNSTARLLPGTEKQTTAMDLMQQARLEMAAPLAKQLGVNPTDKDFQASLDRIFNANSSKESRKQQILALQQRYQNRQSGASGNVLPKQGGNPVDYKSKYGLQ